MKKKIVNEMVHEIVAKGMRLRAPQTIKLSLRPEVYDWLVNLADDFDSCVTVLIRGLLEDAFDKACSNTFLSKSSGSPDDK